MSNRHEDGVLSGAEGADDRPQKPFGHLPQGRSIVTARGGLRVPLATSRSHFSIGRDMTKAAAGNLLGQVVYLARTAPDEIKIGWTTNLTERLHSLGSADLLAFHPGTKSACEAVHGSLAAHRIRGGYFHEHPDVIAVANTMRSDLGLDPL